MASSLQIFIVVLVFYVTIVNVLVYRSLGQTAVVAPRSPLALPPATVGPPSVSLSTLPASTPLPEVQCYDETVYVAVMLPVVKSSAQHTLLLALRRAEHPLLKVHLLLVGARSSELHSHQQWCSLDSPTLPCSLMEIQDGDPRNVFRRALAEFECMQDIVLLGVNSRIDGNFFERLNLAPRGHVTCLSAHAERCAAYRVSATYMKLHQRNTDIAVGAKHTHMYFGAQPVLAA